MPYPHRNSIAGGLTHLTMRGVDRRLIFLDADDFRGGEKLLARSADLYAWSVHAWVFMGNHCHLLVDAPQPELSAGMQRLNALYARRYNARYGRRGHLVEERFGSYVMKSDAHYFRTLRYIVLNPVRARLCAMPEQWMWSSYRATAGVDRPPSVLDAAAVWERFGSTRAAAQREYEALVREALPARAV